MTYLDELAMAIEAQLPPELIPDTDKQSLFLLYALLATTVGEDVQARDVHDAWTLWMQLRGIEHASMVPFGELSARVQQEDEPFVRAIRAVAAGPMR